jgi:hypothetical protein
MSAVWTKEMAEEFLETEPDSMFPCETDVRCRKASMNGLAAVAAAQSARGWCAAGGSKLTAWEYYLKFERNHGLCQDWGMMTSRDEFGRCQLRCANCSCRMLFNQLECVKADLESTKETLQLTSEELHSTKEALEECKAESAEEKRKFTGAIAKMVEREMGDVRTQLNALKDGVPPFFVTMALSKKAASEAAKAALSASKHITLRLLMF